MLIEEMTFTIVNTDKHATRGTKHAKKLSPAKAFE